MLARPATLRDPRTPDQIVVEQHSLTHFPSQSWCKMCVESRARDSPHREQSNIDAVVPQLQFDYGYMGDGGPLQIACFLVGTDTSSGAMHATMVPDSKKMDMTHVVAATTKWVSDLWYARFCPHGDKEGVLQLLLDRVTTIVVWQHKNGKFHDKCNRHRARSCSQRQNPVLRCDDTFTDAAVDNQTPSVGCHKIQRAQKHTYDTVILPLSEQVLARRPGANANQRLQPCVTGLWLGRDTLSDEHLVGTTAGVMRSRAVRRLQEPARWVPAVLKALPSHRGRYI